MTEDRERPLRVQAAKADLPSPQVSDEQLYARFQEHGDREALETLVRRYQHVAYRLAYFSCGSGPCAEDGVQEAFIKIMRKKTGFESRGPGSFRAWFCRVVLHAVCTSKRQERRMSNRERSESYQQRALDVARHRSANAERDWVDTSELHGHLNK